MNDDAAMNVQNLSVSLPVGPGLLRAVNGVSFQIRRQKILGLVGESGCGKSVTCLALMGLLKGRGWQIEGAVDIGGACIYALAQEDLRQLRGKEMAMIMQNPMSAFNPLLTIGQHFIETLQNHCRMTAGEAVELAIANLARVGVPQPARLLQRYPFQCSGGMLQRAMIAIALSMRPAVLIADEPTTSLDVTIQYQILSHLASLREHYQTGILLVSHDLGVIAQMADEVAVMYCGYIVEQAPVDELFDHPAHPYTRALMASRPQMQRKRLRPIDGQPPPLWNLKDRCPFEDRCHEVADSCGDYRMEPGICAPGHQVRCAKYATGQEVILSELA